MTTLARAKHQPYERAIAKELGLSDAQLAALLRIRQSYWPARAAEVLERKGYAYLEVEQVPHRLAGYLPEYADKTEPRHTGKTGLTEAGEALLKRARAMGY